MTHTRSDFDLASCPICLSDASVEFTTSYVTVARCMDVDCGHLFAVGVPPMHGVQELRDGLVLDSLFFERDADLVAFLSRRRMLAADTRVLDVGAGSGHVTQAIRRAHPTAEIICVEADPSSQTYLASLGFDVHAHLDGVTGAFDLILLMEVIEHVDKPVEFMRSIRRLLSSSGAVFITTPCGELPGGGRPKWAYATRAHVQFFTERSLALCLSKSGFSRFYCESLAVVTSKLTPIPLRYLKDTFRPLRDKIRGFNHLTGFAKP